MAIDVTPLADREIIKPIAREEVSKGGVILPDTAKEKPQEGEVIAVDPGKLSEDGSKYIHKDLNVVQILIYSKYAGTEWKYDDEEYLALRESDILAKRSK